MASTGTKSWNRNMDTICEVVHITPSDAGTEHIRSKTPLTLLSGLSHLPQGTQTVIVMARSGDCAHQISKRLNKSLEFVCNTIQQHKELIDA